VLGGEGPDRLQCSRAGCSQDALTQVVWRNPRIHPVEREKVWLSCREHEAFFVEYLGAREFPVQLRDLKDAT
jgi:uncharacterized protein CbrC (UPF0167 family)